ncbi:MAG: hypothetical protein C0596_07305 [Marinilabiliales bacterium]|nr:MAG: hypothetical protein C0596_19060 [Marinilabiliales bacterium]PLX08375.1 MAG: hypothetical protein C0596_07305 [Marinilabiliales bacterium]
MSFTWPDIAAGASSIPKEIVLFGRMSFGLFNISKPKSFVTLYPKTGFWNISIGFALIISLDAILNVKTAFARKSGKSSSNLPELPLLY